MSDYLLKPMNPKGRKLLELCLQKQFVLASGCRLSTKTVNCLFAICDHAWRTRLPNIALITISQSAGVDSGVWQQLTEIVIPTFGLKFKKQPAFMTASKKPYCLVYNQYGEAVKITLESLKHEDEAEARFKSKVYSMIFVTELDNFKQLKTFLTWTECLRCPHLKDNEHLFLGDCNPSDEGTMSWIYKLWFELASDEEFANKLAAFKNQLGLIEFDLMDNIYSSADRIQQVKDKYAMDDDLYKRYVLGQWVTASENALFIKVFKESIHVIGDRSNRSNPSPDILIPETDCYELGGGWDLGVVNSATAIIEKVVRDVNGKPTSFFKILDELVVIDSDFEMGDFVGAAMKKMAYWEDFIGRPIQWNHWSDRSAFEMRNTMGSSYHHQEVMEASDGKIILQAAMHGKRTNETVRQRIDLFRKLLFQNRIFFSNDRTPFAIEMCKSIKKGRGTFSTIQKDSKHKHIFDAITYYIATECFDELNRAVINGFEPATTESGVLSVRL